MSVTEAPSDRAPRSVSVVAPRALIPALEAAIADHPGIAASVVAERFGDVIVAKSFPGDVVLLAEEPGAALLAHARTAIAAGAAVVVQVDADDEAVSRLVDAGARVLAADAALADVMAELVAVHRPRRPGSPGTAEGRPRLSPSERRALAYYAQGMTTVQVAEHMHVGYETAKTFLRRVRAKYAAVERPAGKRAELIVRAEEDGIV